MLSGEFVNLRKLVLEDAEQTFKWRSSERAHLLNKGAQSVKDQAAWIANRPSNEMNFIIELKSRDSAQNLIQSVGMLSLVAIDLHNMHAESARFLIGEEEKVKGKPVAVEAMKLLYEYAFTELKLRRIYGTIAEENHMMIKWQKYLGMKEEGRLRQHYKINDRYQDALCFGILSEEYYNLALPKMNSLIRMSASSK